MLNVLDDSNDPPQLVEKQQAMLTLGLVGLLLGSAISGTLPGAAVGCWSATPPAATGNGDERNVGRTP